MEEQLRNIGEMENVLNRTNDLIAEMELLLAKWTVNQQEFNTLLDYYGSEKWYKDREDDSAKMLPEELPRGVLGEDAVSDTFGNRKDILIKMIKLGVAGLE
ncbi:DUF4298 domain-containing protein [Kaistella palustris]|uniref:DUF4298 domain-containing protein n=1 Tax=Kaistella palustris TaxID=493376 RepID=UPI000412DDD7|nr:DUF4298 domain-containing protein [Kaistella palustris]